MGAINPTFARGVALVIQGESLKASAFVTHFASLGTLRERMVQRFVREETPERFRVETGLINGRSRTSRQCDILVHEPDCRPPLYRWEDFVVVRSDTARAVVEVKTTLNQEAFDELITIHNSVMAIELQRPFGMEFIPTFGYALEGVTFDSFVEYVRSVVVANPLETLIENAPPQLNWPVCIAVQQRRYLGFRPLGSTKGIPLCFGAIDFSRATGSTEMNLEGIETGFFLQLYEWVLRDRQLAMQSADLSDWVDRLPIPDEGKVWISTDAQISRGGAPRGDSPGNLE